MRRRRGLPAALLPAAAVPPGRPPAGGARGSPSKNTPRPFRARSDPERPSRRAPQRPRPRAAAARAPHLRAPRRGRRASAAQAALLARRSAAALFGALVPSQHCALPDPAPPPAPGPFCSPSLESVTRTAPRAPPCKGAALDLIRAPPHRAPPPAEARGARPRRCARVRGRFVARSLPARERTDANLSQQTPVARAIEGPRHRLPTQASPGARVGAPCARARARPGAPASPHACARARHPLPHRPGAGAGRRRGGRGARAPPRGAAAAAQPPALEAPSRVPCPAHARPAHWFGAAPCAPVRSAAEAAGCGARGARSAFRTKPPKQSARISPPGGRNPVAVGPIRRPGLVACKSPSRRGASITVSARPERLTRGAPGGGACASDLGAKQLSLWHRRASPHGDAGVVPTYTCLVVCIEIRPSAVPS